MCHIRTNHSETSRLALRAMQLLLLLSIALILQALWLHPNAFAQTEVQGEVSGVWDVDGSPYVLVANATVPEDESLTINPGVEIVFSEGLILDVNGQFQAIGSEEDTIRFHGSGGVVGGELRFNVGDADTVHFAYCRFDSLLYAIRAFEHTLLVERCQFVDNQLIRLEGGAAFISGNNFYTQLDGSTTFTIRPGESALESVEIIDNQIYRTNIHIISAGVAIAQGNQSFNYLAPNFPRYSWIYFTSCRSVVVTENTEIQISMGGTCRDGAIIENNWLGNLTIAENSQWGVVVRNNIINSLIVVYAFAEFTDNEIWETDISGWLNPARTRFERNTFHEGVIVGDYCFVELTNNILIMPRGWPEDARAIRVIIGNELQSTVTMTNNILISYGGLPFAVDVDVDFVEGGYNCFWGFGGTYEGREENLEGDFVGDPCFVLGNPFEYQLQANSPCIDAGDPDSPEDPDGTRADIGLYFYDQENGMPPAIISRHDAYTGWGMDFSYTARATDLDGEIEFDFAGLPEWFEVEEDQLQRDFVSDSIVVSGQVPNEQEDFSFIITARDLDGLEDTLTVQVFVYPMNVLTGKIGGVLSREGSPYIVADTAYVAADDSLIVEPGCEIFIDINRFENSNTSSSNINVYGYLRVVGTEEDSIYFNTQHDFSSGLFLHLYSNPDVQSEFSYCSFYKIKPFVNGQSISITHCSFDSTGHIDISGAYTIIEDNDLLNTGVSIHQGNAKVVNNIWTSTNGSGGIGVGGMIGESPDSVLISQNRFEGCDYNISSYGARSTVIKNNIILNGIGEHKSGIKVRGVNDLEDGMTIVTDNVISNVFIGITFLSSGFPLIVSNNVINNVVYNGINAYTGMHPNSVFTNNVVTNSTWGIYLLNSLDEEIENLTIMNNLFYNDSILIEIDHPEVQYDSFRYNAMFAIDSLGNEPNYIGILSQTNANGDSCDAGFNIFLDPQIVNLDSLDFHLYAGSPLIDAGNPDASFSDVDGTINDIGLYGGHLGESYEYPQGVGESNVPPPDGFTLSQPYPNPFNSQVQLSFILPHAGDATVKIYDVTGRLVYGKTLAGLQSGSHRYIWRGEDSYGRGLSTGIYYFELEFANAKLVKPVVMVK